MKKRGLSDVVAVTLIILIAIAAVVIVWAFVSNMLRTTGEELEAVCLGVDVKPISCNATSDNVLVQYGAGEQQLSKVKVIVYDVTGASVTTDCIVPFNPLDTKSCTATIAAAGDSVAVAGVYIDDSANEKTCPASTEKATCTA